MFHNFRLWLAASTFLALSAVAFYYMRIGPATTSAGGYLERILQPAPFIFPGSKIVLRRDYTGLSQIDAGLSFLVAAFTPGASGLNKASQLQQIHFLYSFTTVISTWSVESEIGRAHV